MHANEPVDAHDHDKDHSPALLRTGGGVVAVAKPAGLATQAPPGVPSVEAWLRKTLPDGAYVGVPHRLDRAVSGVLLLAVTPRAARKLSRQFERREISKTYLALLTGPGVDGVAAGQEAVWRDWIVKIPNEPRARIATADEPAARAAETRVRFLRHTAPGVLGVRFEPLTGRMHQLRVQAATRGLPIVGDVLYGALPEPAAPADPRLRPIALHAWRIEYVDPDSGAVIRVAAAPPAGWPALTEVGGS